MVDKLNLTFQDNTVVSAAQMNSIVTTVNNLITENNNISALLERISKSELLVLAQKSITQTFAGDGSLQNIFGWTTQLNKGEIFSTATGMTTLKQSGTYTVLIKTLVSADNTASPRSKVNIVAGGNEVGLSEDTAFSSLGVNIQNYRRTHEANATIALNANQTILTNLQVWGATQARIFGDLNTVLKIYREV